MCVCARARPVRFRSLNGLSAFGKNTMNTNACSVFRVYELVAFFLFLFFYINSYLFFQVDLLLTCTSFSTFCNLCIQSCLITPPTSVSIYVTELFPSYIALISRTVFSLDMSCYIACFFFWNSFLTATTRILFPLEHYCTLLRDGGHFECNPRWRAGRRRTFAGVCR